MNAHLSAILLGVKDMERSKLFYTELGWKVQHDYKVSVFFVPHGSSLVGFYGRDGFADMVGVSLTATVSAASSSTTSSGARAVSTRSWTRRRGPAAGSSSLRRSCSGAGTAAPSQTRMATSGTSATARRGRISPTRNR
jgi:hypothetical protein